VVGVFTIIGTIYTVRGFYATSNPPPNAAPQPTTQQEKAKFTENKPPKRNSDKSTHNEKPPTVESASKETAPSEKISVVQDMKDSPGSLQIGVNKAPVTFNATPPTKPLDERIRKLLDEIDPEILKSIKQGYGGVKLLIPPHQHALLSNICAEKGADQYIKIVPCAPDDIVTAVSTKGALSGINLRIYPKLIGK